MVGREKEVFLECYVAVTWPGRDYGDYSHTLGWAQNKESEFHHTWSLFLPWPLSYGETSTVDSTTLLVFEAISGSDLQSDGICSVHGLLKWLWPPSWISWALQLSSAGFITLTSIWASKLISEFKLGVLVIESWLSPLRGIWLSPSLGAPGSLSWVSHPSFVLMEPKTDLRPWPNLPNGPCMAVHCGKRLMWAVRLGINIIVTDPGHLNTHSVSFLLISAVMI